MYKRVTDKLVEECSENIDEKELHSSEMTDVTWNEDKNICRPCTIHVILLALFFIISISIVSVFNYFHWHLKKSSTSFTNINRSTETVIYRMQFHWTYKWEILNKLTLKIKHITFFMTWLILKTLIIQAY